jgi:NADH-quinone oxidoreductase subunit N
MIGYIQAASPLIVLSIAVGVLLLVITIRRSHLLAATTAGIGLIAAFVCIPWAMQAQFTPVDSLFTFNTQSLGFIGILLISSFAILILAHAYWQNCDTIPLEEYSLLLLLATVGAVALAASANFITLFLGLETMTLAMIGMISYARYRPESEEAGLKYLVLSGMSTGFMLFGIGLIVLDSGSLVFTSVLASAQTQASGSIMMFAGLAMISVGFGFKLSVVPFHIWVPDVYAGAPAPTGAFVAVVSKIAVLAVLIRIMSMPGVKLTMEMTDAITIAAILSMVVGNLLALMQENVKRILGYSSIAHLGYLLVALLAAGIIAKIAVAFYLVMYAVTVIGAFGILAILSNSDESCDIDTVDDLRGLFWTRPVLAGIMTLALLSLAGIPPAIGFIAKMYVMAAGIQTNLRILTSTLVVTSVIGLFYYLNIIIVMSFKPGPEQRKLPKMGISISSRFTMAIVSGLMVGFGVAPQALIAMLKAVFG